jgi:ABC-2 type transporter
LSDTTVPTEIGWRVWRAAVTGGREFLAINPPRVLALSVLPRAALQLVFFALLGQHIGGAALRAHHIVGMLSLSLTALTIVMVSEVPVADKESDTFWRIRTGVLPPWLALLARAWPYPATGLGCVVVLAVGVVVVPVPEGPGPELLWTLPCFALMAVTTTAIGLAGAVLALGRRMDILVGNVLSYLLLLCSGAVLPAGSITLLDRLGAVLPLRHGLAAVRSGLSGGPVAGELLAEAAVGAAWLVVAVVAVAVIVARAHRAGDDHFG